MTPYAPHMNGGNANVHSDDFETTSLREEWKHAFDGIGEKTDGGPIPLDRVFFHELPGFPFVSSGQGIQ